MRGGYTPGRSKLQAPDEIEACSRVYNGTTTAGAPCEFHNECAQPSDGHAYCDIIENSVCLAEIRGRAGDPCHGTCTQSKEGNSLCTGRSRPAEVTIANCWTNDGLYCSIGRCQPSLALGEICDNEQACAPSGRCDGVCEPRFTQGEACSVFHDCAEGLYCDMPTGTCERSKPPGAPCSFSNHYGECDPGYCNIDVCAPPYPFADSDLCGGDA